jgi:tripartite-type tricarboxylate transporter receptor subunit TctC
MEGIMKLPRRQFLHLAAGAAVLPAVSQVAKAQAYPTRPVRLVVGGPAGGPPDVVARVMGQWLSERLGQPFIIENRPGAGTNVGTEFVVKAAPDGHTLLQVSASNYINASLYEKLNFDFIRDIAPVGSIMRVPGVVQVNPSVPAKTIAEFIAYAKTNSGKINMASGGIGSVGHIYGELFKTMAGVNLLHVPYRGEAPALTDLIGGQVEVLFGTLPASIAYIRAGSVRALAVTTATRLDMLPDLPTVAEFLPGYEASGLQGIGAPRNTPADIIDKLNKEINVALADPRMQARLADLGGVLVGGSPVDFRKIIADETEKWAKVVKLSGAKAE